MKFVRTPKYFNEFVVTYRGYYGDGDLYANGSDKFDLKDEHQALELCAAMSLLMTHPEDFDGMSQSEISEKFKELGLDINEYDIPYNYDFDSIPTIEEVQAMFFDENGVGHTLTIES